MRIQTDWLTLNILDEGDGPPVLLLHGWPDSARVWRHQVPALVSAGYRVIAPDLRGFGESDKPQAVEAYALPALVGDVIDVLDALEVGRATVVGHGWGAVLGSALAAYLPERVERLITLGLDHSTGLPAGLPWLAAHPDLEGAIADLGRPGALAAALNWYRANQDGPMPLPPIACPVLGIRGPDDLGCRHWAPLEAPDRLTRLLLEFLEASAAEHRAEARL